MPRMLVVIKSSMELPQSYLQLYTIHNACRGSIQKTNRMEEKMLKDLTDKEIEQRLNTIEQWIAAETD